MTMNLTKLVQKLASKISIIQKPHSISFFLMEFKTEITVQFYFKASFCPASFFILNTKQLTKQVGNSHGQKTDAEVTDHGCFCWGFPEFGTGVAGN